MKKSHMLGEVSACVFTLVSTLSHAALFDHGGGLIYDDILDVTWLQDANYAKTNGYDTDGVMTWVEANTWASNLIYFDSVRNVTYDDWRLPLVHILAHLDLTVRQRVMRQQANSRYLSLRFVKHLGHQG